MQSEKRKLSREFRLISLTFDLDSQPQPKADASRLISVYRPRVDECNRLWFIDTGVLEFPGNRVVVQRPSIWVYNLEKDTLIQRFEIPSNVFESANGEGRGLVSLTIDDTDETCVNTYAYITDWLNSRFTVYSLAQNRAWAIDHNYFHFVSFRKPLPSCLTENGHLI